MERNGQESRLNLEHKRYESLDGLRAIAAICIVMMHIKENNSYVIRGRFFNDVIPVFTSFVFLFMIVSAFGICCGYYKRVSEGTITMVEFYRKRYSKILPYFSLLVALDFIMSPGRNALIEAIADLTLCFGLLPNAGIEVIGVGWFLGTVFVFYMLFPFICYLMADRIRVWLAFAVAVFYNIACTEYFLNLSHVAKGFNPRTNILFSSMFFMAGCIIYLYRDNLAAIVGKFRIIILVLIALITVGYFVIPHKNANVSNLWLLIIFVSYLIYAIGVDSKILSNRLMKFLSGISMEIYLCHMIIFRVTEKLHLNYIFGTGWASYIVTFVIVFIGAIVFSLCAKKFLSVVGQKVKTFKS